MPSESGKQKNGRRSCQRQQLGISGWYRPITEVPVKGLNTDDAFMVCTGRVWG